MGWRRRSQGYAIAAPGASTNILTTSLTPGAASHRFRVSVILETASVFNMIEVSTDGGTDTNGLNGSVALGAGDLYEFEFEVDQANTYNFQVETNGIIRRLIVSEEVL